MAAGFRDVLALQGVFPVSRPNAVVTAGGSIGLLTGVWIDGTPSVEVTIPGASVGLLTGVWIDGKPTTETVTPGAVSWMQLNGVWITGKTDIVEEPVITRPVLEGSTGGGTVSRKQSKSNRPILQLYQPLHEDQFRDNIVIEEDDEILSIVSLLVGAGIIK